MKRLLFLLSIAFTLTAGIMIGAAYSDYKTAERKAQQNLPPVVEEVSKWTDTSMAWFTLVLTAATLLQVVLWVGSNKTADASLVISNEARQIAIDSLEQTKRSVDAYVDAERGRMVFEKFEWNYEGFGYVAVFRNIGRAVAIVRGFRVIFNDLQTPYVAGGFEEFIRPSKRFVAGIDDKGLRLPAYYPVPKQIITAVMQGEVIEMSLRVLYETVGGTFFEMDQSISMEKEGDAWGSKNRIASDLHLSRKFAWELLLDPDGVAYFERLAREYKEGQKGEL